jgi:amino acid permease
LIPYVLFIVVAGFFSYVGMYMLSRLIYRFEVKSYSDMCERAFGSKFKKFAEMCIVLYAWGITVCYQVIIAKFILQLLADTFGF